MKFREIKSLFTQEIKQTLIDGVSASKVSHCSLLNAILFNHPAPISDEADINLNELDAEMSTLQSAVDQDKRKEHLKASVATAITTIRYGIADINKEKEAKAQNSAEPVKEEPVKEPEPVKEKEKEKKINVDDLKEDKEEKKSAPYEP